MARVTVQDCVKLVPNRFKLVLYAAKRTRDIFAGAPIKVERDNDKNPVVSLREIAQKVIQSNEIEKSLIRSLQKNNIIEETEKTKFEAEPSLAIEENQNQEEDLADLHTSAEDELQLEDE